MHAHMCMRELKRWFYMDLALWYTYTVMSLTYRESINFGEDILIALSNYINARISDVRHSSNWRPLNCGTVTHQLAKKRVFVYPPGCTSNLAVPHCGNMDGPIMQLIDGVRFVW